jgi:hypothetical protein
MVIYFILKILKYSTILKQIKIYLLRVVNVFKIYNDFIVLSCDQGKCYFFKNKYLSNINQNLIKSLSKYFSISSFFSQEKGWSTNIKIAIYDNIKLLDEYKTLKTIQSINDCMKECLLSLECVAITFDEQCSLFDKNFKIKHQQDYKKYSKTMIL